MKIKKILEQAIALLEDLTPTPKLDAELLLAHVLEQPRSYLVAHQDDELLDFDVASFTRLVERRAELEPMAYIFGQKEFWSLELEITPEVLIPRPETELLVEKVLEHAKADRVLNVADLGTGSGAVALAIASERPNWRVVATDKSAKALQLANYNAKNLNIANVEFCQGDWCAALPAGYFDIVVSNPPYIAESDPHLQQGIKFEPTEALIATGNGLDDLKAIIEQAYDNLAAGGMLALEHGCDQGEAVREFMYEVDYCNMVTHKDLAGLERVSMGWKRA